MPAIVLEGRDESGKTTLANQLSDTLAAPIVKSPAGSGGDWDHSWDRWVSRHAHSKDLLILDRAPEISETVYGAGRGHMRCRPITQSVWEWRTSKVLLIFCMPNWHGIIGTHVDAAGHTLSEDQIRMTDFAYAMLYQILRKERTYRFEVVSYNYKSTESNIIDRITKWMEFA